MNYNIIQLIKEPTVEDLTGFTGHLYELYPTLEALILATGAANPSPQHTNIFVPFGPVFVGRALLSHIEIVGQNARLYLYGEDAVTIIYGEN